MYLGEDEETTEPPPAAAAEEEPTEVSKKKNLNLEQHDLCFAWSWKIKCAGMSKQKSLA